MYMHINIVLFFFYYFLNKILTLITGSFTNKPSCTICTKTWLVNLSLSWYNSLSWQFSLNIVTAKHLNNCKKIVTYWGMSTKLCLSGRVNWAKSIRPCPLSYVYRAVSIRSCQLSYVHWAMSTELGPSGHVHWAMSIGPRPLSYVHRAVSTEPCPLS